MRKSTIIELLRWVVPTLLVCVAVFGFYLYSRISQCDIVNDIAAWKSPDGTTSCYVAISDNKVQGLWCNKNE